MPFRASWQRTNERQCRRRVQERNDLSRQVAEGLAPLGGFLLGRAIRKAPLHVGRVNYLYGVPMDSIRL